MSAVVAASVFAAAIVGGAAIAQQTPVDLDTPFVTTPANVVDAMLDLAKVGSGDSLIDLGSGDGRIVIAAAKRGAQGLGIEINPVLVERSRELAKQAGVEGRARFVAQDLFDTDFSRADVVTMYLLPDVNAKLAPKLFATLRPGARIVSHDYDLGDWPPDATLSIAAPDKTVSRDKTSRVFYWVVPARVEGRWTGRAPDGAIEVDFVQRFQRVHGALRYAGAEYRFADQPIAGALLSLRLATSDQTSLDLAVHAQGEILVGTLRDPAGAVHPVRLMRR